MDAKDAYIDQFKLGIPMLTKATLAVPKDKLDWKPEVGTRTIRQLFTEAVMMPSYVAKALNMRAVPEYEEMSAEYAAMSIEQLVEQLNRNAEQLAESIKKFPESEYSSELTAPWGVWTYTQTINYPYWNMMWHAGQINYIQTLYGDQQFYQ